MYRVKPIVYVLLLFIALSYPAKAQFFYIDKINCKLSSDDEALLNRMGKFEAQFYNQVFSTQKNDSVNIVIELYGKHGEYKQVQKDQLNTTFIDGFYSPMQNRIFLYKSDHYMETLFHETSHNLLHYNYPNAPKWLNEGIATLLGYLVETTNNQVRYVPQSDYVRQVRDSIRNRKFELEQFFNYKNSDWFVEAKRPMLYATSYCLIYFLINQDKDQLGPILVLMKQEYSSSNAIKKTFGSFENFNSKFLYFYTVGAGTAL